MRLRLTLSVPVGWIMAAFLALVLPGTAAQAKDLKLEASLVWATNAEKSPNPSHKPADAEALRKLRDLPLKWKNYFVVTNVPMSIPERGQQEAALSEKCKIEVKDINGRNVEVSLIGRGEPVLKRMQPLPRGETLVVGGNAPNETAWFVVLKRVE